MFEIPQTRRIPEPKSTKRGQNRPKWCERDAASRPRCLDSLLRHQLAGLQTQHSWAMMAGFAPQTCTRTCCHLAAPFPASLLPGARFRAAHPPRPHVGSGVHRRGGLGWVKGRRAYEQSPGPIVSRAGTRLRSPCGAATRQVPTLSIYKIRTRGFTPPFNTFVKLSLALLSFLWHAPDVPCSQGLISSSLERFPTFFTNLRNGGGAAEEGEGFTRIS